MSDRTGKHGGRAKPKPAQETKKEETPKKGGKK